LSDLPGDGGGGGRCGRHRSVGFVTV
jgi:hypothetical protein